MTKTRKTQSLIAGDGNNNDAPLFLLLTRTRFCINFYTMEQLPDFRDIIIEELDKRAWSRKELSQRCGQDVTLINAILRGDRRFNETQILAISKAMGLEPYRLFKREEAKAASNTRTPGAMVPVMELEPSACGNLSDIPETLILDRHYFEEQALPQEDKESLPPFLMQMFDDSMAPTIQKKDRILFHCPQFQLEHPDPNRIFLLNLTPGEMIATPMIRRVDYSATDRTLTVIPDNYGIKIIKYKVNADKQITDYVIAIAFRQIRLMEK
ncbi:MAG: helix-turn-helix domain-containing protein [bacterium]|nr:helix-turn-helix domain-containing protein [bacterium]